MPGPHISTLLKLSPSLKLQFCLEPPPFTDFEKITSTQKGIQFMSTNMFISHDSNVHKGWLNYCIWNRAFNCNYAGKAEEAKTFRNIEPILAASLEVLKLPLLLL